MKKNFRLMAVAVALLTCFTANAQEMNSLMFRAGQGQDGGCISFLAGL